MKETFNAASLIERVRQVVGKQYQWTRFPEVAS